MDDVANNRNLKYFVGDHYQKLPLIISPQAITQ